MALSVQPKHRVEFFLSFAKLEMENRTTIVGLVTEDCTQHLLGRDIGTLLDRNRREVSIDREVAAMTHKDTE